MLQNATQKNIQAYQNARSQASKILRQSKRLAEKTLIEDIEIYKRNPRLFFEKCKYIKQGYKARLTLMNDDQENFITDTKKSILHLVYKITSHPTKKYSTIQRSQKSQSLHWMKLKPVINSLKNIPRRAQYKFGVNKAGGKSFSN